jgi:hypothetical protein
MLMLNDKLKHDPIIDLDNVEESVSGGKVFVSCSVFFGLNK